jgi:hypothetical protein
MDVAQTFTDLQIKQKSLINGAVDSYIFTFSAPVPYEDGDQLYIKFPKTIKTPKDLTGKC